MEVVDPPSELSILRQNHLLKILGVGFGLAIVHWLRGSEHPGIVAANLGAAWLIVAARPS